MKTILILLSLFSALAFAQVSDERLSEAPYVPAMAGQVDRYIQAIDLAESKDGAVALKVRALLPQEGWTLVERKVRSYGVKPSTISCESNPQCWDLDYQLEEKYSRQDKHMIFIMAGSVVFVGADRRIKESTVGNSNMNYENSGFEFFP